MNQNWVQRDWPQNSSYVLSNWCAFAFRISVARVLDIEELRKSNEARECSM